MKWINAVVGLLCCILLCGTLLFIFYNPYHYFNKIDGSPPLRVNKFSGVLEKYSSAGWNPVYDNKDK